MAAFDLVVTGATVVDGLGGDGVRGDVAVSGGLIAAIGTGLPLDGAVEIDGRGMIVAPGFIDIHTHSDISVVNDARCESKVLQGVTTDVIGNCGFSPYPVHPGRREMLADNVRRLGDENVDIAWDDLQGYAESLRERPPAMNVAPLIGHSALRIAAMDEPYAESTAADVARMQAILARCFEQGAWGMTTGLTHTPSANGSPDEVERLVATCAGHDRVYATHARVKAGMEFDAIREAIGAARASAARLQFSHLALNEPSNWGRAPDALQLFDEARASGLDAAFDVYPYDASSSALIQYLPVWAQEGGDLGVRAHWADPQWRERAIAETALGWFGGIPWLWDRVTLCGSGDQPDLLGLTLAEAADLRGLPPAELVVTLCAELGGAAQVVLHYRTEADMLDFLSHPLAVVGSDGNAVPLSGQGKPHPRSFGTFPRVLGRYVRQSGRLGLPEAIAKMTSRPAARLGMDDRGVVAVGKAADLVVFDPRQVMDTATFERPHQAPVGIAHTIIGGQVAVRDGTLTGARAGQVLLRGH